MENKLIDVLFDVQSGDLNVYDAKNIILKLFGVNYNPDELSPLQGKYKKDCQRIKSVLISKGFKYISLNDAFILWSKYCDDYSAIWLELPEEDEEIYKSVKDYIKI